MKKILLSTAIFTAALGVQTHVWAAEESVGTAVNSSLLEKIKKRSSENQQFVALLNDPDQGIRLAAVQEMIASGRTDLKNLALDHALNGDDMAMKQLAFESILKSLTTLTIQTMDVDVNDKKSSLINSSEFDLTMFRSVGLKINQNENGQLGCQNLKDGECTISISGEQINVAFTGRSSNNYRASATLNYKSDGKFEGIISANNTSGVPVKNYAKQGFVDIF